MRKSLIQRLFISASITVLSANIGAASNPINEAYVQLSAADWAAACTSGSPTSTTGCLGNIASPQFAKLNRLLGWPSDFANTPIVSTANSIFIQQYGGNSSVPFPSADRTPTIDLRNVGVAGQGGARCALYTLHGNPSGWQGTMAGQDGIISNGQPNSGGMVAIAFTEIEGASAVCDATHSGICFANQNNPRAAIALPQYLLCIGSTFAGSTEQPASLFGIIAS